MSPSWATVPPLTAAKRSVRGVAAHKIFNLHSTQKCLFPLRQHLEFCKFGPSVNVENVNLGQHQNGTIFFCLTTLCPGFRHQLWWIKIWVKSCRQILVCAIFLWWKWWTLLFQTEELTEGECCCKSLSKWFAELLIIVALNQTAADMELVLCFARRTCVFSDRG